MAGRLTGGKLMDQLNHPLDLLTAEQRAELFEQLRLAALARRLAPRTGRLA